MLLIGCVLSGCLCDCLCVGLFRPVGVYVIVCFDCVVVCVCCVYVGVSECMCVECVMPVSLCDDSLRVCVYAVLVCACL